MAFSDAEKRRLSVRAQSIRDRIERGPADPDPDETAAIEDLIETWKENVADGDDEEFRRRTAIAGVDDEADLPAYLAVEDDPSFDRLPQWVETIDAIQTHLERNVTGPFDDAGDGGDEPFDDAGDGGHGPFHHVVWPIVEYAVDRLEVATTAPHLRDSALRGGAEILAKRLRILYLHPLFIEFKTMLRDEDVGNEGDASSTEGYETFVCEALETGLREFYLEYAVLAKWTTILVDQWVAAFDEFARRLARDWDRLEETFGGDEPLGDVVAVEAYGDRHHGGRQVLGVTTESGTKLAYKPRDLRPEARYYEFLAWLNEESPLLDLRVVDCVPRESYGWMEWIDGDPCSSAEEVRRYYERVGYLICVSYVLRFVDGNLENVVASGDHPVVVDLECLMHPDLPESLLFADETLIDEITDSVLWTGILPQETADPDIEAVSGIDEPDGKQHEVSSRTITDPNTDAMELLFEDTATIEGRSLPEHEGETASPYDHVRPLKEGFERAYDFFRRGRDRALEAVRRFEDVETRIICRNTSAYGKVGRPLLTSSRLRSGLRCDVRIEHLLSWFDLADLEPELWEMYEAEREAMWNDDVPRFTVSSSGTDVFFEDRTVESVLETPPIELVRRRLRAMDEQDRSRQLDLLTAAYERGELLNPDAPTEGFGVDEFPDWEAVAEHWCEDIFEQLRGCAVRKTDGDLVWYHRTNSGDGVSIHALRDDIYDGRLGIGLYAAALAKEFGRPEHHQLVTDVTDPLIDALDDEERFAEKKLGGAHGLGSLVYGFTKLGAWLDEPRFTDAAREAGSYITEERLEDEDVLDLIGGVAGAILGLLALHDETGDERVLSRARAAGDVLLENRTEIDGVTAWQTYVGPEQALVGPGHGIAGIALALYRLTSRTGDGRFASAARESLRFEERHYSPAETNWPDFRFDSYRQGWCAGRAGIGLSRLGMLEVEESDPFERDLRRALDGVDPGRLVTEDQICCGNFSRVEFLLRASRALGEETYRRQAEELAAAVLQRADQRGRFSVPWQNDHWYAKSVFLGEPGIGISLLRLAGADLPCLLLLE